MTRIRLSQLIAPAYMPVHRDIRSKGHAEYWFPGGRGSLKSSFISLEIALGLLKEPQANAMIYRKVAATLRESVYGQMQWAIDKLGLTPWFLFKLSPMEMVYRPTGQRILFRGADDPAKSKSIKLAQGHFGFLWFEELAEFENMRAIQTIQASIIRGQGSALTFYSYNPPESARSWVNEAALNPPEGRMIHKSTYLDAPREWLGEAFIAAAENLKRSDERSYRHMYLGEVTGTGGQVFERLVVRPISNEEIRGFGATYAGLDFGWFPDPAHFVRCAYDPARRRLWVYDEYRAVRTPNRELYRHLVEKKGLSPEEEVIADSAEMKSINDLRSYGMNCVGATKGPGSVNAGMKWLQSLQIIIDPARCPAAAREFSQYEYEKTRDGTFVSSYPDRENHAIDAVRYALNRVWARKGA